MSKNPTDEVHVIGPNHDGADLRREKAKNPRNTRCSGHTDVFHRPPEPKDYPDGRVPTGAPWKRCERRDDQEINTAFREGRSSFIVSMTAEEHRRIFGDPQDERDD